MEKGREEGGGNNTEKNLEEFVRGEKKKME